MLQRIIKVIIKKPKVLKNDFDMNFDVSEKSMSMLQNIFCQTDDDNLIKNKCTLICHK